jgi:hypothetical protein
MNTKSKFFFAPLLFILISSVLMTLESRDNEFYMRKIIPSKAFYILNKVYREGDSSLQYRVLVEFQEGKTISAVDREKLGKPLFFKSFCIANVSIRDIFHLVKNRIILRVYVLSQAYLEGGSNKQENKTVIGIIDMGIDWKNKCFMKEDGSESRIAYLWDQNGKENDPVNNDLPYGVEYRKRDIDASINSCCNLVPIEAGHGWIISALAAGNVIIHDEKNIELFPAKSIDLPIIMVNTTGKMEALVDAVAYITSKSAQMKSNCVINFSYCKHTGPHDPNDMYIRALDALLNENSLMVVAAGNEGMKNIYIRKAMQTCVSMEFKIDRHRYAAEKTAAQYKIEIETWNSGLPLDKISLISSLRKIYGPVEKGEYSEFNSPDGFIFISSGIPFSQELNKKGAIISIISNSQQAPKEDKWTLLLENTGNPKNKVIEAWITKSENCDTQFKNEENPMNTISFLAFSKKSVSVGSWMYSEDNMLMEAEFSNNPWRNLACLEPLPNVMAVGRVNVAIPGFYGPMRQDGTSVSTALITRFIAQTWNENPELKASDLKKFLKGKVITFNDNNTYLWNGSPIYKLENKANTAMPYLIKK